VAPRVTLKRLLFIVFLAIVGSIVLVPGAVAGDIADDPCFDASGPDTATCPAGAVGTLYSITIKLKEGSGCGDAFPPTWSVSSGTFPPGLSLSSNGMAGAVLSGTPTEAGNFTFYMTVRHPFDPAACAGDFSDKKLTIPINPGVPPKPKLTIGPESSPVGTVGTPYALPMTANLPDAKTWSISAGALPPGLTIGASNGVIAGTPTTAGSYSFTVLSVIDASTSDTKSLGITVRAPLTVAASEPFGDRGIARTEIGVRFESALVPTGGLAPYTMTLGGVLPDGLDLDLPTGVLSGRPEVTGTYRFTLAVTDAEGRSDTYSGRIVVAPRLAIVAKRLKPGKVGRLYRSALKSVGGVHEVDGVLTSPSWRIKRGPLPRGIRFDRTTGSFVGIPSKAGTWVIAVEIVDALRVKATTNVVIVVAPIKPKR
jgi:hypothetical protein